MAGPNQCDLNDRETAFYVIAAIVALGLIAPLIAIMLWTDGDPNPAPDAARRAPARRRRYNPPPRT